MNKKENFNITNKTQANIPNVDFFGLKNTALGEDYSLSLVFIDEKESKRLNETYRNKNKPTNVLSFPLDKKSGEIFITLAVAKKEAKNFERGFTNFVAFLFIHALCHLKGYDHGSTMERAEQKLRKQFLV